MLGFSASLTAVRLSPQLLELPFMERASALLEGLASGEIASAVVEDLPPPPAKATIDSWSFQERWERNSEGREKLLGGYPDYAVLSPETGREAWAAHSASRAGIEEMWGDSWQELTSDERAGRDAVLGWLEALPADAVVVAKIWDQS